MSTTLLENAELSHESEFDPPAWAMDRARNGAAWLDSKFGPEWDREIDLETLDIGTMNRCILGQLGLQSFTGIPGLRLPSQAIQRGLSLGFLDILTLVLPIGRVKRAYWPLNAAWKALVRERRDKKPAQSQPTEAQRSHRQNRDQAA